MKGSPAHRFVALATAYAVAVYALLPALAAVLPTDGVANLRIICSGGTSGGSSDHGAPVKPQPACPCPGCCPMPGCGAAASPRDWLGIDRAVGALSFGPAVAELESLRRAGSNRARGPPLA
jgi:hypothetical protein